MADASSTRRELLAPRLFGAANVTAAALLLFGVFVALPARWAPVDYTAAAVSALLATAGVGLLARTSWGREAARLASFVVLGVGLVVVATLALTASYLNGIYGPVGRGGAIILVLVAALLAPYVIVLPAVQLLWLGPRAPKLEETPSP